jgi:hypothetical protein
VNVQSRVSRRTGVVSLGMLMFVSLGMMRTPRSLAEDKPATGPAHQVIACYFHRTQRCPTCQKISAYIEESIKAGFESELKDKSVRMVMVDFQDPKNQKYAEAYEIDGPTLVLMHVRNGKIVEWKPAPKVWSLVGQKPKFVDYVQSEVRSYLEKPIAGGQ